MGTLLFIIGIIWLLVIIAVLTCWHEFISDQEDHSLPTEKSEDGN